MDITFYDFVVSFESGEQIFYTTESRDFVIREVYISDALLTDETYPGIAKSEENDYDTLLQFYTGVNTTASEYAGFKHFCEEILNHIENNDTMTNFFIKDVDGNTYYNLVKDEIVGIYFEGLAQADENTNKLRFKLFIYTKRKDD